MDKPRRGKVGGDHDPNQHVVPITATDPVKRLDALIRRFGGKPAPVVDPTKMTLPAVSRKPVKDQMSIDDV